MNKRLVIILTSIMYIAVAIAQNVTTIGAGDYVFRILSKADKEVELCGYRPQVSDNSRIELPSEVVLSGESYSLVQISDNGFSGVGGVENQVVAEIILPVTIRKVSAKAFAKCRVLKAIECAEENPYYSSIDGVLFNKDNSNIVASPSAIAQLTYEVPSFVRHINEYAFYKSKIRELLLNDGIETIDANSFEDSAIEKMVFPSSLAYVGVDAFSGCKALTEIKFNGKNTILSTGSFRSCGVKAVDLPLNLSVISEELFAECKDLTTVTFPPAIKKIGLKSFYSTALRTVDVRSALITIGESAFRDCKKLETVQLSGGVEEVGCCAFSSCDVLEKVLLGMNTKSIADYAFKDCVSLRQLSLPTTLERVGKESFVNTDLINGDKVILSGSKLVSVGERGMSGMYIDALPSTLWRIDREAFKGSRFDHVKLVLIPNMGEGAFMESTIGALSFEDDVRRIPNKFFKGVAGLSEIIFPNRIDYIGIGSFNTENTCLQKVVLSQAAASCIDKYAFYSGDDPEHFIRHLYVMSDKGLAAPVKAMVFHYPVGSEDKYVIDESMEEQGYKYFFDIEGNVALQIPADNISMDLNTKTLLEGTVDNFMNLNLQTPSWRCINPDIANVEYDDAKGEWFVVGLKRGKATLYFSVEDSKGVTYKRTLTVNVGDVGIDNIYAGEEDILEDNIRIYTMDGVHMPSEIDRLPKGLYIKVCGNKKEKIIIH